RLIVGLRRHADAAQARRHADQSAVAVRAAEAGWRAVLSVVHAAVRARDGHDPLFQCLRSAPGSRIAVLRRDLAVLDGAAREARAGDVRDSQADITKAKRLLGYEPTISLEQGLRQTLDWCRAESAAATGGG